MINRYFIIVFGVLNLLFFSNVSLAQSKDIGVGINENTSPVENRYAFLVGIDHYDDPTISSFKSCRLDAANFETFLVGETNWALPQKNIAKLNDPSKDQFVVAFKKLLNNIPYPENSTFYFFYSGHGLQGKIVPADYKKGNPEKLISYNWIKKEINARGIKAKVFILDACYSGSIIDAKDLGDFDQNYLESVSDETDSDNFVFFTASNNITPAGKDNSFFTKYFLESLKTISADKNNDSILSSGEIYDELYRNIGTVNSPEFAGSRKFPMATFKKQTEHTITNISIIDSDKDGIQDKNDECPDKYGPKENNGCPIKHYNTISHAERWGYQVVNSQNEFLIEGPYINAYNGTAISSKNNFYGLYSLYNLHQTIPNEYERITPLRNGHFILEKFGEKILLNDKYQTIAKGFYELKLHYYDDYYYEIINEVSRSESNISRTNFNTGEVIYIKTKYITNYGKFISRDRLDYRKKEYGKGWNYSPSSQDIDKQNEKYKNIENDDGKWGLFNENGKQLLPYCSDYPIEFDWSGAKIILGNFDSYSQLILKVQFDGTCEDNCLDEELYQYSGMTQFRNK